MWISTRHLYGDLALTLPFFIANVLVVTQTPFFLALIRPLGQTTGFEQWLVLAFIALAGVGGVVALLPLVKEKRIYIVNALAGTAFITFAFFGGYGLGYDFYKCDILQIPNCD